jgi:hypothetical protein
MTVKTITDPQDLIAYLHKLIWLSMQGAIYFGKVENGKDDWGRPANHFAVGNKVFYWASLEQLTEDDLDMLVDTVEAHDRYGAAALAELRYGTKPADYIADEHGYLSAKQWLPGRTPIVRSSDAIEHNPTGVPGKVISIALVAPTYSDPQTHIDFLCKLIELEGPEIIAFSSYNRDIDDHDNDAHPFILLNDVFGYAVSDGEALDIADFDLLVDAVGRFEEDGAFALMSIRRGAKVIKERHTKRFVQALEFINARCHVAA